MSKTEGPKSYHFPHFLPDLDTLRVTKTAILTPKIYDSHPCQVKYW